MIVPEPLAETRARVEAAFARDGLLVKRVVQKDGALGMLAEHARARVGTTARPKRAFYLEGDNYQMGFVLGLLAREDLVRMTHEFLSKVLFAFFDSRAAATRKVSADLRELIVRIATSVSRRVVPDVPRRYLEEIQGIVDGCREAGGDPAVTRDDLITLNFGFDALLAHVYSGKIFARRGFAPEMLRTPIGCNAFALGPSIAGGRCFFGRDFMFPTANVYQDTACLIVYRPRTEESLPFVSQTAPGIIGAVTAMNTAGVAMGVNMLPTRFCSPERPGFNSLPLVRDCIERCTGAPEAVKHVAEAQRGVTWLYPVADSEGRAFVVEAGKKLGPRERFPYFTWVPWHYRRRLPSLAFIRRMRRRYGTPRPVSGAVVRGTDYRLPREYTVRWNRLLWKAFDRDWVALIIDLLGDAAGTIVDLVRGRIRLLWPALRGDVEEMHRSADFLKVDFSERGFINESWTAKNCPGPFYFAPQRGQGPDLLIATNHALSPEMRLTAMNEWIALLAGADLNDMQWRYDELSREILDALDASPAGITEEKAWDLINFLRPDGRFPDFYNPGRAHPAAEVQVHGSVTLCELASRTMKSLFGYYGDEPMTIHLPAYVLQGGLPRG